MLSRLLQSWPITVVLIAAIIWIGFGVLEKRAALKEVEKQEAHLKEKIEEVQQSDEDLVGIDRDTYLERQARIQLNYKYPDEEVVHVFHNNEVANEPEPEPTPEKPKSNPHLWWDYLWGN